MRMFSIVTYCIQSAVFEKAIVRIEHLIGEEIEELARHASVIKTLLSVEYNPEPGN